VATTHICIGSPHRLHVGWRHFGCRPAHRATCKMVAGQDRRPHFLVSTSLHPWWGRPVRSMYPYGGTFSLYATAVDSFIFFTVMIVRISGLTLELSYWLSLLSQPHHHRPHQHVPPASFHSVSVPYSYQEMDHRRWPCKLGRGVPGASTAM